VTRVTRRPAERFTAANRVRLPLHLVLLLASSVGCAADRRAEPPPNIVWILLDTVGTNHIGIYGYERDTTPVIDSLARDGLVFENAIAQSSWTLPSFSSMMTSRYPGEIFAELGLNSRPSGTIRTLTEVLKDSGYRTISVTTNPYNWRMFRLMGGFDRRRQRVQAPADWVIDRAIEQLEATRDDTVVEQAPFFLFLHFMDAHFPLMVPAPYDRYFPTLDGKPHDESARTHVGFGDPDLLGTREFEVYRSHTFALYDGCLRFIDTELGRLLDYLKQRKLYENSVIVVSSDHGQEFWDHAAEEKAMGLQHFSRRGVYGLGHGHTLFPVLVRVPLIFHGRNVPRGRAEAQVRNIDIAPTILAIAGASDERFEARGVDLLDRRSDVEPRLPAFGETATASGHQKTLLDGRYQYLRVDDREYLFDTASGDLADVSKEHPEDLDRLRAGLDAIDASFERPTEDLHVTGEEIQEKLKALGYVE